MTAERLKYLIERTKEALLAFERNGIATNQESFMEGVHWADCHAISPWISVEDRLPDKLIEDGIEYEQSIPVAVKLKNSSGWHMAEYFYDTDEWICEENNTFVIQKGLVTHWMRIPELKGGAE